ncbi:thermonuclease family protein [Patescibacteria group bacterium]|nr:thermonuclease family protein [Patescibacteria group bacterium]MCL5091197.1 thermonuclease family protein [Patescibacteria group bacterium]
MGFNRIAIAISLLVVLFIAFFSVNYLTEKSVAPLVLLPPPTIVISPPPAPQPSPNNTKVLYVVDGDTIVTADRHTVRYVGIDTPELPRDNRVGGCFAQEAKKMNQRLVDKKVVRLEKDVSETDQYNRLLRYVWINDPLASNGAEIFVNDYLVRQGFAYAAAFAPDTKYSEQFTQAENEARQNKRGLWNQCR